MAWKYWDLRKTLGYETWVKGDSDKTIKLEKKQFKSKTPYTIKFETFVESGKNATEFAKTRLEAIKIINIYKRTN